MLHRLRRAMIRPGRERLSSVVEVDESTIGRSAPNKTRATEQKQKLANQLNALRSIVVIAVELKEPKGFGRIRLRRVVDTSAASVLPFVKDRVEPGSLVRTDSSCGSMYLLKNHTVPRGQIWTNPPVLVVFGPSSVF